MKWNGFVLTGSVRNDWVDQEIRSTFNSPNLPVPTLNRTTIDQQRFSALSYRVGLGYEFDFGLVPYASYSTSFNPQITGTIPIFHEETDAWTGAEPAVEASGTPIRSLDDLVAMAHTARPGKRAVAVDLDADHPEHLTVILAEPGARTLAGSQPKAGNTVQARVRTRAGRSVGLRRARHTERSTRSPITPARTPATASLPRAFRVRWDTTTESRQDGVGSTIGIATISPRSISAARAKCGMMAAKA